ncbi:ATP-grasp fold amidoligase family protein [Parvibaculum sedimenti]|nr:ATP-grasp fold amidoligase family protein [Parvibaculum sedimenti]
MLIQTMAFAMYKYHRFHGTLPDFVNPSGYNEHIFRRKFFAEFSVPESGNKLLTSSFIPAHLKGLIRIPEIVWHSPHAELPTNNEIAPGFYYLKANHGSNMFQRIEYPLKEDERRLLERKCAAWLANDYGVHDGEWWYSAFPKEILIEKQVGSSAESIAWNVYIFKDRIGLISAYRKTLRNGILVEESTWFDEDFQVSRFQSSERPRLQDFHLSEDTKARLVSAALDIAKPFDFNRVDFLIDEMERIYLGEITFTPSNGLNEPADGLIAHFDALLASTLR